MISLTRREFEILSNTLIQTWIEAHWSTLARRARRQSLPDPKCNQPRDEPAAWPPTSCLPHPSRAKH